MPVISGGGAAFNGGTITAPLTIDLSASAGTTVPLKVIGSYNAQVVDFFAVVNGDAGGTTIFRVDSSALVKAQGYTATTDGHLAVVDHLGAAGVSLSGTGGQFAVDAFGQVQARDLLVAVVGTYTEAITAGALPTASAFVSGTGKQISSARDVHLIVPCTMNPTAGAAATVIVALSPDNTTYSNVGTLTEPAGIALDGTILLASLAVPGGWYVKLTATNATIGTATYY